jgi:CPA1 family monovalent cation:H+ antiporter
VAILEGESLISDGTAPVLCRVAVGEAVTGTFSLFPGRDLILLLTFCIILVTLVAQGFGLPVIVCRLGLAEGGGDEEHEARCLPSEA